MRVFRYNGNSQIFSIAHVELYFELSGLVKKRISINSVNLELTGSWQDTVRMVLEFLVVVMTGFTLFGEIMELVEMGANRYFSSFWNYVDCLVVGTMLICCVLWITLFTVASTTDVPAAFDLTNPADQLKLVELSVTLDGAVAYVDHLYICWTTVNIMVCFIRVFKFFAVQDRLMVVFETLRSSSVDIVHFFVTFGVSFFCFSLTATVMFGLKMKSFHTIASSSHSLFAIANGDYTHLEEMRKQYPAGMGALYTYVS